MAEEPTGHRVTEEEERMNLWLFRAGANGEYELKFLEDGRIYLTWNELAIDLKEYGEKEKLFQKIMELYRLEKRQKAINWVAQIYPIAHRMEIGDWVVLPSKLSSTVHIGKIVGEYEYHPEYGNPFYHSRRMEWFAKDIPRSNFDQDILYSFGAFLTVCRIRRNNAEARILEMAANGWQVPQRVLSLSGSHDSDDENVDVNIEDQITDSISKYIIQKFKGHHMEWLIEEILKAKGFTTYHSPRGADGGVDILASGGTMGFGSPKICVQVKTQDMPVDRPTLDQLGGVMNNVNAEYGILVSWSGFKESVSREAAKLFFKIRLWSSKEVIQELFDNYEKMSAQIRAEIPLKKIWLLSEESSE